MNATEFNATFGLKLPTIFETHALRCASNLPLRGFDFRVDDRYQDYHAEYKGPVHLDSVFSLEDENNFIGDEVRFIRKYYSDILPEGVVPVGRNFGGHYIFWESNPNETAGVYYWDHNLDAHFRIAENLSNFYSSLIPTES